MDENGYIFLAIFAITCGAPLAYSIYIDIRSALLQPPQHNNQGERMSKLTITKVDSPPISQAEQDALMIKARDIWRDNQRNKSSGVIPKEKKLGFWKSLMALITG